MRAERSPSQILFSLLPEQTVDLNGRIWKVDKWLDPLPLLVDQRSVRNRLLVALAPWSSGAPPLDNNASSELRANHSLEVVTLNPERGVHVEMWPLWWRCPVCGRLGDNRTSRCQCGTQKDRSQLHFVGFHECGHLSQPWVQPCPSHGQVAVRTPGSSKVNDLVFYCPICTRELRRGLAGGRCRGCQQTGVHYNVHRASSVYTPHSFTMVNPPRPEQLAEVKMAGGAPACLEWLLEGMPGDRPSTPLETREAFIDNLVTNGLPRSAATAAASAAAAEGHVFAADRGSAASALPALTLEQASDEALDVALAVWDGRRPLTSLANQPVGTELKSLYSGVYLSRAAAVGLADVDLVDRFPVLKGVFGYTRGGDIAGSSRVVLFRGKGGAYRVYADANETEAYFLRLDPVRVAKWLHERGLLTTSPSSARQAREAILHSLEVPKRGDDLAGPSAGSAVLTLLHSYSHRFIRQLAVMAGIDRDSLSEYLVPHHLGVFVYATPKGDFVLGGMQAVFETDMHLLLARVLDAEQRCPMDPGCARGQGACSACLHLGEPSCSYYNGFLSRDHLFGPGGFFTAASSAE